MKHLLTLLLCYVSLLVAAQDVQQRLGKDARLLLSGEEDRMRVYVREKGRGFAITSNLEGKEKTVCYCDRGNFRNASKHPLFQQFLKRCSMGEKTKIAPSLTDASLPDEVPPLLTDQWHQGAPYNLYSPMVEGEHCVTGCVAHSMAQIIRYHRYAKGNGEHTYTDDIGCGETLHTSFPAEGYNFEAILDTYPSEGYDTEALQPLAQLLYDCGVAVDMCYGLHASSADAEKQPRALVQFFGYDIGVQQYYRDHFKYSEWENMLKTELSEGRPMLMTALSPSLSHAMCCDGYDAQGLFHLNFGNGGDADGYYYLPYLTPLQPEWYDVDNPEGGMNLIQSVTTGILPRGDSKAIGHPRPVFAMADIHPLTDSSSRYDSLTVIIDDLANIGWDDFSGPVYLALKNTENSDETEPIFLDSLSHVFSTNTTYRDTISITIAPSVEVGTYRLVPLIHTEEKWEEVHTSVGIPNYLLAQVEDNGVTLMEDLPHTVSLQLQSFNFPDTIVQGDCPEFSFDILNTHTEYCGRFYVILEPVENPGVYRYIQYQGLSLQAGEQTRRYFHRSKVSVAPGDYHLRVCYDLNLFNDSVIWFLDEPLKTLHVVPRIQGVNTPLHTYIRQYYDLQGRHIPYPEAYHGVCIEIAGEQRRKVIK